MGKDIRDRNLGSKYLLVYIINFYNITNEIFWNWLLWVVLPASHGTSCRFYQYYDVISSWCTAELWLQRKKGREDAVHITPLHSLWEEFKAHLWINLANSFNIGHYHSYSLIRCKICLKCYVHPNPLCSHSPFPLLYPFAWLQFTQEI